MQRPPRNYYQIYRVDHKRNQEQMVAEVEGLHEAEKLVEKYLRNMSASEKKDEIKSAITGAPFRAAYRRCSGYRGPANSLPNDSAVGLPCGKPAWPMGAHVGSAIYVHCGAQCR